MRLGGGLTIDRDESRAGSIERRQIQFSPLPLFVQLNSSHQKPVAHNSVTTSRIVCQCCYVAD